MAKSEPGGQRSEVRRTSAFNTKTSKTRTQTRAEPKSQATPSIPPTRDDGRSGYLGGSAPFIEAPRWQRRRYIDRAGDLAALAQDLKSITVLALDAEFAVSPQREPDKPVHQLSLLQMAVDEGSRASFVIDAQRIKDLSPLRGVLEDGGILKLFHSIGADAKVLAARDLVAAHTLDLEAVSRSLFGQRGAGLQSMVYRASGIWLDKSFQRADWWRRPLTAAMRVYAAKDAEMTLLLYRWLQKHYAWAVQLHEVLADEPPPDVAEWILSSIEGPRQRHATGSVLATSISTDISAEKEDLQAALQRIHHPALRARVMRLIADLEVRRLAPDLYRFLGSPAADERQASARALGRLHDRSATGLIRLLLNDAVEDVRQAAALAVEQLSFAAPVGVRSRVKWSDSAAAESQPLRGSWQDALLAHFGTLNETSQRPEEDEDDDELIGGESPQH